MRQTEPDAHSRDLAAFIAIALEKIYEIGRNIGCRLGKERLLGEGRSFPDGMGMVANHGREDAPGRAGGDWATVAMTSAQVAQSLMKVEVPVRHKLGTPWEGPGEHSNHRKNNKKIPAIKPGIFFVSEILFFLQNDAGIDNFDAFTFFVNQHRVGIRFADFILQVKDHGGVPADGVGHGLCGRAVLRRGHRPGWARRGFHPACGTAWS